MASCTCASSSSDAGLRATAGGCSDASRAQHAGGARVEHALRRAALPLSVWSNLTKRSSNVSRESHIVLRSE